LPNVVHFMIVGPDEWALEKLNNMFKKQKTGKIILSADTK
jgi:hypothetical protein